MYTNPYISRVKLLFVITAMCLRIYQCPNQVGLENLTEDVGIRDSFTGQKIDKFFSNSNPIYTVFSISLKMAKCLVQNQKSKLP